MRGVVSRRSTAARRRDRAPVAVSGFVVRAAGWGTAERPPRGTSSTSTRRLGETRHTSLPPVWLSASSAGAMSARIAWARRGRAALDAAEPRAPRGAGERDQRWTRLRRRRALDRGVPPTPRRRRRGGVLDPSLPVDELPAEGVWNALVIWRELQALGHAGRAAHDRPPASALRAAARIQPGRAAAAGWPGCPEAEARGLRVVAAWQCPPEAPRGAAQSRCADPAPSLELLARHPRPGWVQWGDEMPTNGHGVTVLPAAYLLTPQLVSRSRHPSAYYCD